MDLGTGGGFMRDSEVGVTLALSWFWLFWVVFTVCSWGEGRALGFEGVEGGRIGAG
jgi:hypothetical protein